MEVLTTSTLIPIGLVMTVGGALVGFVKWMTTIHNMAKQNKKDIQNLKEKQVPDLHEKLDSLNEKLIAVSTTMAELKGSVEAKLEYLVEHTKKHN